MLLGKLGGRGFKVSAKTESCTRGIWIWGAPTFVEERGMHVLLLDTEGSGSLQRNTTHDAKVFALVVLISSLFIYNSMGSIDETAISNLSVAAELSNHIAVFGKRNKDEALASITPHFLWLLRDFVLEMREGNREITEAEYLQSRLDSFSRSNHERNRRVRDALTKFFRQRDLITMVRPVEDEEKLVKLDRLGMSDFRKPFREKAEVLKRKVFFECPVKEMNGKFVSGAVLAELLKSYVQALNDGAVPDISSAWESVVEGEREKFFERAKAMHSKRIKSIPVPAEAEELYGGLAEAREEATATLMRGFELGDTNADKKE